jgi:hypothetical protein
MNNSWSKYFATAATVCLLIAGLHFASKIQANNIYDTVSTQVSCSSAAQELHQNKINGVNRKIKVSLLATALFGGLALYAKYKVDYAEETIEVDPNKKKND